jgi:hypothetical protein
VWLSTVEVPRIDIFIPQRAKLHWLTALEVEHEIAEFVKL